MENPDLFRGDLHIAFCTQCVITTLEGGEEAITDDVLKFRKPMEFQSSSSS